MYPEIDFIEFVAVVKAGGFSKAALELGTSKSHVSKKISRLEQRLGIQLLRRSTRIITLTDIGKIYYQRCAQIIDEIAETESLLYTSHGIPSGTLNLSLPNTFGEQFIVPLAAEFMLENRRLTVHASISTRNVDLIDEHIDVAVRIGDFPDSRLVTRQLCKTRWIVCANSDYLEIHGEPLHPEQLQRHFCLVFSQYGVIENVAWGFKRKSGEEKFPVSGVFFSNNGDALLAAARTGVGLIYLPEILMRKDIANKTLLPILTDWMMPVTISAVYPYSRHLTPKVKLFLDFLARRLNPLSVC